MINSWPIKLKEELKSDVKLLENIKNSFMTVEKTEYWSFPKYEYNEDQLANKIKILSSLSSDTEYSNVSIKF